MSFLRALRAYVGLGPDEEIEDRYLYELNSRRRVLDLDELEEEDERFEQAYADADIDELDLRRLRVNPRNQPEIDLRDFETDETVQVRPQSRRNTKERAANTRRPDPEVTTAGGGVFDESEYPTDEFGDAVVDGAGVEDDFDEFEDFEAEEFDENDGLNRVTAEFLAKKSPFEAIEDPADKTDAADDEVLVDNVRTVERDADREKKMRRGGGTRASDRKSSAEGSESGSSKSREKASDDGVVRSLDVMRAKPRTLIPESFADAKMVADEFKRDVPVLLNLQSLDRDLARRLIDFASGICYALDGSMEKIASQVFLLIPDGGQVSDEDRRRIEERGYAR